MIARLVILLAFLFVPAFGQRIDAYAGTGTSGFSGDSGSALQATFNGASGMALDPDGNLYVCDPQNNRVRKVTPQGVVTTFAGNGNFVYSGDGGPATLAGLWSPEDVAVDNSGNVYISDALHGVVRRVDRTGIITRYAGTLDAFAPNGDGGSALNAKFSILGGIALDRENNLFIVDKFNNVVRKVTREGLVFRIGGIYNQRGYDGDNKPAVEAKMDPQDVAVDDQGNVYVADGFNNRVRRISPEGLITTFAGNGTFGFSGDGGQAAAAQLTLVPRIALDRGRNLYIVDNTNVRVRKVFPNGIITTIAGTGALGNSGDGGNPLLATFMSITGVEPTPGGDLFVASNNRARKITYNCSYAFTQAIAAFGSAPAAGSVNFTGTPGCQWFAFGDALWLTVGGPNNGQGNAVINFNVAENFSGFERTAFILAGSASVPITQRGMRQVFQDVLPSEFYFDPAHFLLERGIATGHSLNPPLYFPNGGITRSDMAVFMIRAIFGGDNFTQPGAPYFVDVPPTHPKYRWIQKLRDLELTNGTSINPPLYSPDDFVTRAQMAKFLIAARYGANHEFSFPGSPYFDDVPATHPLFRWMQELKQSGITAGTGPTQYSPDMVVTRGQMAMFIMRAFFDRYMPLATPVLKDVLVIGQGEVRSMAIQGENTHFGPGSIVDMGPDIPVSDVVILSPTQLTATVVISGAARPGPRPVVVRTGTEDASKPNGFVLP